MGDLLGAVAEVILHVFGAIFEYAISGPPPGASRWWLLWRLFAVCGWIVLVLALLVGVLCWRSGSSDTQSQHKTSAIYFAVKS